MELSCWYSDALFSTASWKLDYRASRRERTDRQAYR